MGEIKYKEKRWFKENQILMKGLRKRFLKSLPDKKE